MANELLPCPFCGAHLPHMWSLTLDGKEHSITCTECPGRAVFKSSSRDQAIAAWNRRAAPAQGELTDAADGKQQILSGTDIAPADQVFFDFWYSHMIGDQMTGAVADVSHAAARYIWDAALMQQQGEKQ